MVSCSQDPLSARGCSQGSLEVFDSFSEHSSGATIHVDVLNTVKTRLGAKIEYFSKVVKKLPEHAGSIKHRFKRVSEVDRTLVIKYEWVFIVQQLLRNFHNAQKYTLNSVQMVLSRTVILCVKKTFFGRICFFGVLIVAEIFGCGT